MGVGKHSRNIQTLLDYKVHITTAIFGPSLLEVKQLRRTLSGAEEKIISR